MGEADLRLLDPHTRSFMQAGDTIVERYDLFEILGEGGFGKVHRAHDNELNRTVAIKVLDPYWTATDEDHAETLRARFRREATATAQIRHPHVVTIYDVGELPTGEIYLVMEYLRGHTLADALEKAPYFTPDRAVPQIQGCLQGLAQGHAQGIVHKDLKPSNLVLTMDPVHGEILRVIDFGIARVLHEQKLTVTGRIVGTPRYLAPEYIDDLLVTPALDVYQMGLILVEMLAGDPCIPKKMDHITSCERHLSGDLDRPVFLLAGPLGRVLDKALSTDPNNRYQDGAEFAAALGEIDLDALSELQPTVGLPAVNQPMFDETLIEFANPYRGTEESSVSDLGEPDLTSETKPDIHHHFKPADLSEETPSNRLTFPMMFFLLLVGVMCGVVAFVIF